MQYLRHVHPSKQIHTLKSTTDTPEQYKKYVQSYQ